MAGPRDLPPGMPYPVDWRTGQQVTGPVRTRLEAIMNAQQQLFEAMHFADGTQADAERFGSRTMAIAATQIELGVEMAIKAVLTG